MRGYNFPKPDITPELKYKSTLVGCRRCHSTWYETRVDIGIGINGPMYDYDCCDKCIKNEERDYVIGQN